MDLKFRSIAPAVLILLTALYAPALAELSLPAIFSDHMVLQFGQVIPIWGQADPGRTVKVTFRSFTAEAVADSRGRWRVEIGPLGVGGPDRLLVSSGEEVISVDDVLSGEVWICSGQSNMEFTVNCAQNADTVIAKANYPKIRQFKVAHVTAAEPQENLAASENPDAPAYMQSWEPASPETVAHFTAAGYFFARCLQCHIGDTPIGLINSSWGGSVAEAWVSDGALRANPETANILTDWTEYFKQRESWQESYNKFLDEAEKAKAAGKAVPVHFKQPSALYNAMIAPLVGYGIRGVLWYQGEANVYRAEQYAPLFKTLITDWRSRWGRDLPFIWVQLPNFDTPVQNWAPLRDSQAAALSLPNTAMAVTIDAGERGDIHPRDKQTVGRRLSIAARGMVYLENLPYRAPTFNNMLIQNGRCRIELTNTADSLITTDGRPPRGFMLAGDDMQFIPAETALEQGKLTVWSSRVQHPMAVRYAWENYPHDLNLYSSYHGNKWLPVTPFRTDDLNVMPETEATE